MNLNPFSSGMRFRIKEGVIEYDEECFIIGKFSNNPKNNETIEIDSNSDIVISDDSTGGAMKNLLIQSVILFALGLGMIGTMFIIMLSSFGLI